MSQDNPGISSNFKKPVHPEQFDQVVEAILAGKYSWACVLMLRFSGYNIISLIGLTTDCSKTTHKKRQTARKIIMVRQKHLRSLLTTAFHQVA